MKFVITLILITSLMSSAKANERVDLPKDYRETFVKYLSLDRIQNPDQFIRLFANNIAMQGKDKNGDLANGSVLVAEVYSVQKNQDGTVKTSQLGRRIKKELKLLAIMEKQEGFGKTSTSQIPVGNWDFAAYKPDGSVAPKNLDECRACHTPLTQSDFIFSMEHLPERQ